MRRLKAFAARISARDPDRQAAEIQIRSALMNRFSALDTAEHHRRGLTSKGNGEGTLHAQVTSSTPIRL